MDFKRAWKSLFTPDTAALVDERKRRGSARNISGYIRTDTFQRLKQDVSTWRDSFKESESAWYPHRVKMQNLFNDTIINGHVTACMTRRKDLTLLKDFGIYRGKELDEKTTELFKSKWFYDLVEYILDANAFGYSLIELGDLEKNAFPNLKIVPRWNVSPDRENVTPITYSIGGIEFNNPNNRDENGNSFYDWCIWVPTTHETGQSKCGLGYLAKVALYEIYIRNNLGYNARFVEVFGQPLRIGKTSKTDEAERAELEAVLRDMGHSNWGILDPTDEIQFIESALGGTGNGYKSYDNLEERSEKKISKIILGHADALDSTPGKLGANEESDKALRAVEVKDNRFVAAVMNDQVIPKLMNIGFPIPAGVTFKFSNDLEIEEARVKQDASSKTVAETVKTLKDAGYEVDPDYITERTGIPVTKVIPEIEDKPKLSESVKNKLSKLYGK